MIRLAAENLERPFARDHCADIQMLRVVTRHAIRESLVAGTEDNEEAAQ